MSEGCGYLFRWVDREIDGELGANVSRRQRSHGQAGRGRRRTPWVVIGLAALVGITAVALRIVSADALGCRGNIPVRVVVTPELAPVLEDVGNTWLATQPQVAGKCVSVKVEGVPAPTVASSLSVHAGRAIDTAAAPEPTPSDDAIPTVWIPDSTAWLGRVQEVDRAAFADNPRSIASSPVLVAMPEVAARAVGWPAARLRVAQIKPLLAAGGPLKLGIAEPRRDTASLAATMLLGDALATSDADLPALVKTFRGVVKTSSTGELLRTFGERVNAGPVAEQAILAYNATNPLLRLVGVQLDPAAPVLDYPYAIRAGLSRETTQAAQLFRTELQNGDAVQALAKKAFRTPTGQTGAGFPASAATDTAAVVGTPVDDKARVARALGLWSHANSPSRTLALFDITSSMSTKMATASGAATRSQVMVAAAQGGLNLFAADSRVGMWTFGPGHQEILPIEELTPVRRAEFDQKMAAARPVASNRLDLYDSLLATYKVTKDGYDATRPNIIIALTDGGDSDTSDVRREQFNQDLQRLADPTKPIRVVLIGITVAAADAANLQAIAGIVGGGFFPLTSPEQIQTIFIKALLRVGAA
jgi:Ca-activated chloride channel family protein